MAFHLTRLPEMTAMVCAILERPDTAATTETAFGQSVSTNDAGLLAAPSISAASASAPSSFAPSASASASSARSLVEVVHQLPDAELEALLSQAASGRAEFDRVITVAAGEAAKRSERALGHGGLAQRRGHRTVIQLVQSLTGESKGEAARQVKVGELIGETDAVQRTSTSTDTDNPGDPSTDGGDIETSVGDNAGTDDSGHGENDADQMPAPELAVPWQYPVTAAIMTGVLSAENGHLILRTLDGVSETCSTEVRRAAATELVDYATGQQGLGATLHEDLLRRARQVRDRIDPDGIAERYTQRYERRSLKTWHDRDGALNLHAVCDDDSGVFLTQLFDLALSPRRGGPRFTTKDDVAWAQRLLDDPRSNEQLAFDTLLTVLHDGAACNTSTTFRGDRPAVRVITVINTNDTDTTDTDTTGTDRGDQQHDQSGTPASVAARNTSTHADRRDQQHGQLEGSAFALPHTVVEATVCTDGAVPITVDRSGRALNLGRTRRLFSPAQRTILRARDGGCLWPGCDRPPWQTEAHHINNYAKHHGKTDIADGVSLCKFHHLNLHNNHWRIRRRGTQYELIPPPEMNLPPIPLHPKSTTWEHVQQHTG